jgi:ABC-2 type transport system permease protein
VNVLWQLSKRSIRNGWRAPEGIIPMMFISVFFLFVNTGALGEAFNSQTVDWLHGNNYLSFQVPVSLLFVVTAAGGVAGFSMVSDIENGYFDKLLIAPINRTWLLLGQLAAGFISSLIQCVFVICLSVLAGARIDAGVPGVILLVLLASLFGVAYAGIGQIIALKTRNYQAVNMSSLIFFPLLFMAPAPLPRDEMQGWLQTAATYNPVSYIMEGLRSAVLHPDLRWGELGLVLLITVVIGAVLTTFSVRALGKFES